MSIDKQTASTFLSAPKNHFSRECLATVCLKSDFYRICKYHEKTLPKTSDDYRKCRQYSGTTEICSDGERYHKHEAVTEGYYSAFEKKIKLIFKNN